jgi:hypothetical protein
MPTIPAAFSRKPGAAVPFVWLTCACSLFAGGCFTTKRPSAHLTTYAALAHPIVPAPVDIALADAPEISVEARVAPLVVPHGAPVRPRAALAPAPERATPEKSADPIMAPELTDAQVSAAKTATESSLAIAEQNLRSAKGKSLNTAQQDMVSKIRGFVDSAREAMKNNDWQRAQTQARKAEVLSQEIFPNP